MRLFGIFFIGLVALNLGSARPVLGEAAQTSTCPSDQQVCALPYLTGLVMGDPRYADAMKIPEALLPNKGFLVVSGYTSTQINGTTYVYFDLQQHVRFSPNYRSAGQIVGEVIAAPGPGYEVTSIYFKPPVSPPGGISVGNQ